MIKKKVSNDSEYVSNGSDKMFAIFNSQCYTETV